MAAPVKQTKAKKPMEPIRKIPAWTGARASSTFSAGTTPAPSPPPQNKPAPDAAHQRVLQALSGLTGTTITLITKTAQRYEAVIASTSSEGNTSGVTLKDAKELTNPGAPLKDSLFIASTNIDTWSSGPAGAVPDSFQTDTDISRKAPAPRERVLQAWQPGPEDATSVDLSLGSNNGKSWDQFAVNESMYGVKATFDEETYTTKLDRSAVDFKERERKAQRLANEINSSGTSNPHIAEERGHGDDSGINEEDKYGAVVRGASAYVPPGARRSGPSTPADGPPELVKPNGADAASKAPSSPAPSGSAKPPADPIPAFREFVTNEKQRLTAKKNALQKSEMDKRISDLMQFSQSFKLNKPMPEDLVSILAKDEDKQRAIREKTSKDAVSEQARAIGGSFHAPSAARGAAALAAQAKQDGTRKPSAPNTGTPKQSASNASFNVSVSKGGVPTATPVSKGGAPVKSGVKAPIPMSIQIIPPFKGRGAARPAASGRPTITTNGSGSGSGVPLSPTAAAAKLNAQASSFRPTPKQQTVALPAQSPSTTSNSRPQRGSVVENANAPANPFFGARPIKKTPVHVKDDFNPFKHNTVAEASYVTPTWPYSGKRYIQMFPQAPPNQQPQQPPHMGPPGGPHMGPPPGQGPMPPTYEEDSAQQAAARGAYVYYPYYPGQQMMPGMVPQGPPGSYMQPHMQPMYYPPPNGQPMYGPPMGMPPQGYMQPHPGQYQQQQQQPGPNGPPRQPGTPNIAHAHPYYHHSPQLQHAGAVPYMMMAPPPGAGNGGPAPHGYEGGPPMGHA